MESRESGRQYGVLTRMAREMVSLRLTAEDRALIKRMCLEHTKRAAGLRTTTATDIIRWSLRVGAKELGVSLEDLVVEPVRNGAPKAKEEAPRADPEPSVEVDPVAAIVEAVTNEPTSVQTPVESDQPEPTGSKEPGGNAPLPDELEDMLKGV